MTYEILAVLYGKDLECLAPFNLSEYEDVRSVARALGGKVVSHKFEYADTELLDDYSQREEEK